MVNINFWVVDTNLVITWSQPTDKDTNFGKAK